MTIDDQIAVMQAFRDGKEVQSCGRNNKDWTSTPFPAWDWVCFKYRIKPEPKLVPLCQSDIPDDAVFRRATDSGKSRYLPQEIHETGVQIALNFISYESLMDEWEMRSTSSSRNWHRCFKSA